MGLVDWKTAFYLSLSGGSSFAVRITDIKMPKYCSRAIQFLQGSESTFNYSVLEMDT